MVETEDHPRLILPNFLSLNECKEFEFIHKSCSTVGYRPGVLSTILSHLIATNSSHLIFPFISIRERLKEKVEEYFGCEYELFVEFTGLISWTQGAKIGWHSDDNRPYLKQRDFAVVCYLNDYGKDFLGGLFHFQNGEPRTVLPVAGTVIMYTADNRNIHSVDEITTGERLTLTLWFTRDQSYDEDAKLLSLFSQSLLHNVSSVPDLPLPLPASSNMYWFTPDQVTDSLSGFNICWARIHTLGFDFYSSQDTLSASSSSSDSSELLMKPLLLVCGNELFKLQFANILHVLQVLQFYYWKATELPSSIVTKDTNGMVEYLSKSQQEKIIKLRAILMKDCQAMESVFKCENFDKCHPHTFDWADISAAVHAWEDYTRTLHESIVVSLPSWRVHQSLFSVQPTETADQTELC